ncbi:MAG: hypothetical protein CVV14_07400 [Gammaproteobacteria bacterium HGW-Gammaproteobacteria-4]|nr:MAG: hypothetical protein CVV14_07400 [Gammaproteobacteria bacterium HGW-Gammaproteobacteria-4]
MPPIHRLFSLVTCLLFTCTSPAQTLPASKTSSRMAALMNDPEVAEISGLASSRLHADVIWVHNDSFDKPMLYALSTAGKRLANVTIAGVENIDWEDIAAFTLNGKSYLLIADTGDNGGIRQTLQLHIVREPEQLHDQTIHPQWSIRFRWPDGPRDCEAVAVDARRGEILLFGKKRVPADLLSLPLRPHDGVVHAARVVGALAGIAQPNAEDLQRNPVYGRYRSQITAADISPDGRILAVLNYRAAYIYRRRADEDWARAVARPGTELVFPWLAQAEAIGFTSDGKGLWISSERQPTPLLWQAIP